MKLPNPVIRRYKSQKISHNGGDSGHAQPGEQLEESQISLHFLCEIMFSCKGKQRS